MLSLYSRPEFCFTHIPGSLQLEESRSEAIKLRFLFGDCTWFPVSDCRAALSHLSAVVPGIVHLADVVIPGFVGRTSDTVLHQARESENQVSESEISENRQSRKQECGGTVSVRPRKVRDHRKVP